MRKLRLMFRWTFVFVLLGMLHVHANAYRQNRQQVTLSMKAVSLKDVLWAIERQTSFVFMYNEEDLDKIGKVDVDVQGDDIRTILNVCLRNTCSAQPAMVLTVNSLTVWKKRACSVILIIALYLSSWEWKSRRRSFLTAALQSCQESCRRRP